MELQKQIGIIGGGQLGKMLILEAKKMGFFVRILDPTPHCPSHSIADEHIVADFQDASAIRQLAQQSDVITYELEHVDAATLAALESEGKTVYPTAKSLELIQNKFIQKTQMRLHDIPVPDFCKTDTLEELYEAAKQYGYPFLLKTCTGGYDGRGNYCVNEESELPLAFTALGNGTVPLMAERYLPFLMEISVLTCRGIDGELAVYPVAENRHVRNILEETRVPANISEKTAEKAMGIARKVMEIFEGVGMFCVELFVDTHGHIFVNEVAPRPHNSGHYTIEACATSQFEQHIRAITGLPLGSSVLLRPAVMRNILGEDESFGSVQITGERAALSITGAYLHIYGKEECRPHRKMGHITVISDSLSNAIKRADQARSAIRVFGNTPFPAKGQEKIELEEDPSQNPEKYVF